MTILPAAAHHAAGIARVHVQAWQAAYAGLLDAGFLRGLSVEQRTLQWCDTLARGASRTLVALDGNDDVQAFVSHGRCRDAGSAEDHGEIWALYAHPACWGQGVGRALMACALDELRQRGYSSASLWVLSRNERATGFYRALGFEHCVGSEARFDLGGREVEEVRMLLPLGT